VREAAARMQCMNNLKQIGLASINCADTYAGALPPAWGNYPLGSNNGPYGTQVFILPFMEQQNAYNNVPNFMADTSAGPWGTYPVIKTFVCPSDWGVGTIPPNYKAVVGQCDYQNNGFVFAGGCLVTPSTSPGVPPTAVIQGANVFEGYNVPSGGTSRFPASIPDGTTNTIFWTEALVNCGYSPYTWCQNTQAWNEFQWSFIGWYNNPPNAFFYPNLSQGQCQANKQLYDEQASSGHTAAVMAGLADGSVRPMTQGMSQYTYTLALIPNDGLPIPSDW